MSHPTYGQPPFDPARDAAEWQARYQPADSQVWNPDAATSGGLVPNGQVMVGMGHIEVTDTEVRTPMGTIPLSRASFTFVDHTMTTQKIPTWAIVCTVAGFFVVTFFSLFFLLAKETVTMGQVVVGVRGGGLDYSEPMQVVSAVQVRDLLDRVQYANNLSAMRSA
ncbi:hypothetical protein [Brooklawnia cerclae]|uniref:Uncharacterized protein n=1 Tax=Brooklawnia cerclae TaxID=349934 RepID=A0ABX0SKX3_9ACTN|nr:hypothetical protein [Brooklawnia cerclae]NIH57382.1 hypothetical protein [Brooklawnia cerclae]